jgi:hypothetical protein
MSYTKRELRNTNNQLLKRVQRQMDKAQSCPAPVEEDFKLLKMSSSKAKSVNIFEEVPVVKQTRLGLYKKRGGRY